MTHGLMTLALGTALIGCSKPAPRAPLPEFTACAVAGLPNCRTAGDLTFGGQPTPEALQALAAQGYKIVVSTRADGELDWDERAAAESLGMAFVRIPMPNPVTAIGDEQVVRLDSVLTHLSGKALLHCGSGNRMAGLYGVWLVEKQGVDREKALEIAEQAGMTRVRPVVEARLAR